MGSSLCKTEPISPKGLRCETGSPPPLPAPKTILGCPQLLPKQKCK